MPPQAQIPHSFSSADKESAESLATVISNSDPESLEGVLNDIVTNLFLSSFAEISQIDKYVWFIAAIVSHIPNSLCNAEQLPEPQSYDPTLRSAEGPQVLCERLSFRLHQALWWYTSRAVTPDDEDDRRLPDQYYKDAAIYSFILARSFATQPVLRDRLWREVEITFIKGLFSGEEPEPAVFIVLAVLILGAGSEIRDYLLEETHSGKGMDWVWYNNAVEAEDIRWGWGDIIKYMNENMHADQISMLPGYVDATFGAAMRHLQKEEMKSWDASSLKRQFFAWVTQ